MIDKEIDNIINESNNFDINDIELIKKQGVVFTKSIVCEQIIKYLDPNITDIICEPSVGKGSFVFNLLEYFRKQNVELNDLVFFVENRLYCYDIDINFINTLKTLLNRYFSVLGYNIPLSLVNIQNRDFLFVDIKFDIILGNPPYVRIQNLDNGYVDKLKMLDFDTIKKGNIDLYYAFIEKSLKISKKIGFIIPNSFLINKTGETLREIINSRLVKIYDNKNNKIWENISAYTCIIVCNEIVSDTFEYETESCSEMLSKKTCNWFKQETSNDLKNIIKYANGGIATLRDKIYKFDYSDDNYVYRIDSEIKIEKLICKNTYKSTTKKDYWFIYPYIDNKIISEDILSTEYPMTYKYLLDNKDELNERDNGNINKLSKYDAWYSYGRKQGLLKELNKDDVQIILPITFIKGKIHYKIMKSPTLILSGLSVVLDSKNVDEFIRIIESNEFHNYLEKNNKVLFDTDKEKIWLTLTTTSLINY